MKVIGRFIIHLRHYSRKYGITITLIGLFVLGIWQIYAKEAWLTYRHYDEIYAVIENFEKSISSLKVHQNPEALAEIATGKYLEFLNQTICQECPSTVLVATNVNIEHLRVLDYKKDFARVFARVEVAWVQMRFSTQETEGGCQATASEGIYHFVKEDGYWKVSGGEKVRTDTWTPLEGLRNKVCP
ncbi:MAG: hypothetical protein IAE79_00925 [Anaerolinea sp.]|nr:hypothetical protein [Anaerolinea sp.]